MLSAILNDRGEVLDPEILLALKSTPRDQLVIAADLHYTLMEGGVVPTADERELFRRAFEATRGAFVVISNSDVIDVDAELAPLKLPVIGRGHLQVRLDPSSGIEVTADKPPLEAARVREAGRFAESLPGFSLRFNEPYIDFSIRMDHGFACADAGRRIRLLDRVYVYTEALFIQEENVAVEMGFNYVNVSHGRPDKAEAIRILNERFPGRTLVGLGDEVHIEGPMLQAVNALGGYGFYVMSPFTRQIERHYVHDILADHRAVLALLSELFPPN